MCTLGLKSNLGIEYIEDRLQYHPDILEFHLNAKDMENKNEIVESIRLVKSKGIQVVLHHPPKLKNGYLDIISKDPEIRDFYDWSTRELIQICKEEQVHLVIHPHYANSNSSNITLENVEELSERIQHFQQLGAGYLWWENTIEGIFSSHNPGWLSSIVRPLQLSLCFDVSHDFLALKGNNEEVMKTLESALPNIEYFHVVDSMGKEHDGLPLGEGRIDWRSIKPFLKNHPYIFEIDLSESNHKDSRPMYNSWTFLQQL